MNKERIIILMVFIVIFATVQSLFIIGKNGFKSNNEDLVAKLNIYGGIAGMQIEVDYYKNGSIIYRNLKTSFERQTQVSIEMIKEFEEKLKNLIDLYPQGFRLEPKPGSADFFTYKLTLNTGYRIVVFEWTDTSNLTHELQMLSQSIFKINDIIVRQVGYQIYLNIIIEKYEYKVGEKVVFKIVSKNVGDNEFRYSLPTPCHPNFKVIVYSPDEKEFEIYPKGVPMGRPCIQVIEERLIKVGEEISAEYEHTLSNKGKYIIKAWFPYSEWSEKRWETEVVIEVK
ncbi:MAG: hypothetical protein N3F64_06080 [Nitrososphaeria archaeon]|nr:hypothetical protein [Nitrososphaeria archaeon]